MFAKTNRWLLVGLAALSVLVFGLLIAPVPASAAPTADPVSNSCLSCHEDLYYLYDSGKYYCITEHKDRCVNCHEGNASVMNEDQAHLGLTVHPQENDGAKCQECHAVDSQVRLDTFASLGGFSTTIKADAYIPSTTIESGFPAAEKENRIVETWPFLVGGIVVFGLWLVLVLNSPLKP